MDEVLVFQHDPFEDLGFFAEVLEKQGASFRTIRLFHGEMPAEDWEQTSALIILGGPMSVADEEQYPFLRWEKTHHPRGHRRSSAPIGSLFGCATHCGCSRRGGSSRTGERNRLVSDFDHAPWAGGFVARLSSRKRCGVSMARRWFWSACRREALGVVHLLRKSSISSGQKHLWPAVPSRDDVGDDCTVDR